MTRWLRAALRVAAQAGVAGGARGGPRLADLDSLVSRTATPAAGCQPFSRLMAALGGHRGFAAPAMASKEDAELLRVRNIGISAHIDSGKTTLTERVLYYTGRIHEIHEVRGKDGVGAKMDSMELEREKGITIQSAATYCMWRDHNINIIDTPGHVDFTIEVERALRVLDGAVLVLCCVGGVQSQSITVDRQMRRYGVPRLIFINKLDRTGADPAKVIAQVREKLRLRVAPVQLPIGLEAHHVGVVDLVRMVALYFEGPRGDTIREAAVPEELRPAAEEARRTLIESVGDVDDALGEAFLEGGAVSPELLRAAIRRATLSLAFVPVFMGAAFKNKGVQSLLDGVLDYLPAPPEVVNHGFDLEANEAKVQLSDSPHDPLVMLAFKLDEGRFGQLTYMRVYQGTLRKGASVVNQTNGKKIKVPRLVRMHSDEMEDIESARAGEIVAMFGVECATGDTFTDGKRVALSSMRVPDPVMSLAISTKARDMSASFSKALSRFQREDPTFRVSNDAESGQTIISGMGELHLEIYVERMRREYKVECEVGKPQVNFRETITARAPFDYTHKKQSGGQGQYGKVVGYMEPLGEGATEKFEFVNGTVGNNVPPNFVPAIEKGFREAANAGSLIGFPVEGARVVLTDGAYHAVDSNELAFRLAALHAFRQGYEKASAVVLEPVMLVEVRSPAEFQGTIIGGLNRRKGMIVASEIEGDGGAGEAVMQAEVPLNNMFGFSTDLRSMTQGKGEFTMEYLQHRRVDAATQAELSAAYHRQRRADRE